MKKINTVVGRDSCWVRGSALAAVLCGAWPGWVFGFKGQHHTYSNKLNIHSMNIGQNRKKSRFVFKSKTSP